MEFLQFCWKACKFVLIMILIIAVAAVIIVFPCGMLYAFIIMQIKNDTVKFYVSVAYYLFFIVLLIKGGRFAYRKLILNDKSQNNPSHTTKEE